MEPEDIAQIFHQRWGINLNPKRITTELLDEDHEKQIMAEYGAKALIRYYSPDDPRVRYDFDHWMARNLQ